MEKNKNGNRSILKVLSDATNILGDNWSTMICATALSMVSIFCWLFFPLFGIVLMFFATGFISLGYIKFTVAVINNKKPQIEHIYGEYKECFGAFTLRVVMCVLVGLWTLLLIIPGIICALNYSFAMSIKAEDKKLSVFSSLEKSKQMTKGYRDIILNIYLLWFLMIVLVFGGMTSLFTGLSYLLDMEIWLIFTLGAIITLCADILVLMPFKQVCLTSVYLEAKESYKENKKTIHKKVELVGENK